MLWPVLGNGSLEAYAFSSSFVGLLDAGLTVHT